MRVAIVSDYLPDYVGGAQTSMREQKAALSAAGHHCVLVTAARSKTKTDLAVRPVVIMPGVRLPLVRNTSRLRDRLQDYLKAERIEVVHVQSEFGLAHAAISAARALGIRVVHTAHTFYWTSKDDWHGFLAGILRRALSWLTSVSLPKQVLTNRPVDNLLRNATLAVALRSDRVISPSAHQATDLKQAGVSAPIITIANPVVPPPHPPPKLPSGPPNLVWIARAEVFKRPLEFAHAARQALNRGATFSVDFVGGGPLLNALRAATKDHPEFRVHGELPRHRVIELIDSSSAVVLSSIGFDNQPMTIAEAVTRHRGVIYCDPRLSEGLARSGYLIATPTVEGMAEAIETLCKRSEIFDELSQGAVVDSETFSPTNYVQSVLAAYED